MSLSALAQPHRGSERRVPRRDVVDDVDPSQRVHVTRNCVLRYVAVQIPFNGFRAGKSRLVASERAEQGPDLFRVASHSVDS